MPRLRKITTPFKGEPKIHWVEDVTEPYDGFVLDKDLYQKHPLYKYLPDISNKKNVESVSWNKKVKELDILRDESGLPLIQYHCTPLTFERFWPLSFFGSLTAAKNVGFERIFLNKYSHKIKGKSYDEITEKKLKNRVAWQQLQTIQRLQIIPVLLSIKNPLVITDLGAHNVLTYKSMILNLFEQESYSTALKTENPILQKFAIAGILLGCWLPKIPPEVDMIFNDPHKMKEQDVVKELTLGKMFEVRQIENTLSGNENVDSLTRSVNRCVNSNNLILQRMIRFLERKGYDGMAFPNWLDDDGTMTYVAFRPEQVIRLDREIPNRIFKKRLSKTDEQALSILEVRAFQRCSACNFTMTDKKMLVSLQQRISRDIPAELVEKDERLKKLMPLWQRALNRELYD